MRFASARVNDWVFKVVVGWVHRFVITKVTVFPDLTGKPTVQVSPVVLEIMRDITFVSLYSSADSL